MTTPGKAATDVDFDSIFSSSPLAQSTPRLRLEPSFGDDGSKKLKNVPAESRSLFDRDHDRAAQLTEPEPIGIQATKHDNTPTKAPAVAKVETAAINAGDADSNELGKRGKNRQAMSKVENDSVEGVMHQAEPSSAGGNVKDNHTDGPGGARTEGALKSKDNNSKLQAPAKRGMTTMSGLGKASKDAEKPSMLVAQLAKRPTTKQHRVSMIPKPAGAPILGRRSEQMEAGTRAEEDDSRFDVDELQWQSTKHIGMRRI
jgi:hypothetical protein